MYDGGSSDSDARNLAGFGEYARQELPRLVRRNIEEVLHREMQPVEASLVSNLVNTIQECQDQLFHSYLETVGRAPDIPSPPPTNSHSNISLKRTAHIEQRPPSQDLRRSRFFDPLAQEARPQPISASEVEPYDLRKFQNGSSEDDLLSDYVYGNEYFCTCSGICCCAATTFAHGELDDGLRLSGSLELHDEIVGENDWTLVDSFVD